MSIRRSCRGHLPHPGICCHREQAQCAKCERTRAQNESDYNSFPEFPKSALIHRSPPSAAAVDFLACGFVSFVNPSSFRRIKIAKKYKKSKIVKEWSAGVAMRRLGSGSTDLDS
jgi:hypothetical protein